MSRITEIAPDIFQITSFVPEGNLQFNQFLVRDLNQAMKDVLGETA